MPESHRAEHSPDGKDGVNVLDVDLRERDDAPDELNTGQEPAGDTGSGDEEQGRDLECHVCRGPGKGDQHWVTVLTTRTISLTADVVEKIEPGVCEQ